MRPRPRPLELSGAAVGAAAVWALSTQVGVGLPFAAAFFALLGGLNSVASSRAVLRGAAIGVMLGAFPAVYTGLVQFERLPGGPLLGPWLLVGVYFCWCGTWFGWMGYALGDRQPFGDPHLLPERVATFLKRHTPALAAGVTFTVGLSVARTVVSTLAVGATAVAWVLAVGLRAGDAGAEHFHRTRLGEGEAQLLDG